MAIEKFQVTVEQYGDIEITVDDLITQTAGIFDVPSLFELLPHHTSFYADEPIYLIPYREHEFRIVSTVPEVSVTVEVTDDTCDRSAYASARHIDASALSAGIRRLHHTNAISDDELLHVQSSEHAADLQHVIAHNFGRGIYNRPEDAAVAMGHVSAVFDLYWTTANEVHPDTGRQLRAHTQRHNAGTGHKAARDLATLTVSLMDNLYKADPADTVAAVMAADPTRQLTIDAETTEEPKQDKGE